MRCSFKPGLLTVCCALATLNVTAADLPLEVVGLYVTGAEPVSGGSGYKVNDTLTLPGGTRARVSKTSSANAVTEVSITQPVMHACRPVDAVVPQATSGSGKGAAFSLKLLTPTGYGTRLLTRCYTGPALTINKSDTNAARAISFLADGSLDTPAIDRFTATQEAMRTYKTYRSGVTPRIGVWNDQGGGSRNALQAAPLVRPTLTVDRLHGNSRAVMFDSHGGVGDWDPADTFLYLPQGVAVAANQFTLAAITETTSAFIPVGFVTVGPTAGRNAGLEFSRYSPRPTACDGAGDNAFAAEVPTETPAVIVCTANAQGKVVDMQGTSTTASGGNNTRLEGGTMGQSGNKRSGNVSLSAAIVVPWSLDDATRAALQASLYSTFGLVPQIKGVIVVLGDSHADGAGAPFQQGWTHQMMNRLDRNDIQLVNAAVWGGRLSDAVNQWSKSAQPNLAAVQGSNKIVILQGGYNDQQTGSSTGDIIATYRRGAALAHAAGAKAVCVADVLRAGTSATNRAIAEVNNAIRAPLAGCDAVIDWPSVSAFNQQSGPYPPPYFADDHVHLSAQGQAKQAQIAAPVIAALLH